MDENAKDPLETHIETVRYIRQYVIPPGTDVRTPFKSMKEWLNFLCENEHRSEPVSEYKIEFEPPYLLACLVGYRMEWNKVYQPRGLCFSQNSICGLSCLRKFTEG